MRLNADTLASGHRFKATVAVFGSGPAGLTVAKTLAERGVNVLVAEGGDVDFTDRSQSLYEGEQVGGPDLLIDSTRLRMFGGTSNHWGGFCRC